MLNLSRRFYVEGREDLKPSLVSAVGYTFHYIILSILVKSGGWQKKTSNSVSIITQTPVKDDSYLTACYNSPPWLYLSFCFQCIR
jgi:hypothetical protein